ncbi:MAG: hypothetical protein F2842_05015 [Actinobacteria bacterium]|uniref:Unannotated protein n=1 Tax=freshwater metagenome TaxID=449393 RepID=A0A6J7JL17_9ZZZZ|nr:hypothetical protein [Actinomycetota bacterium]
MPALCVGCGLCCDGTMFHATDLAPTDDRAALESLGTVFVADIHSTRFEQPCPAQVGGCCTVYPTRPMMCRDYNCALLLKVEEGAIGEADARVIVDSATTLRDRVHAGLAELDAGWPRMLGSQHLTQRVIRAHKRHGSSPELEHVVDDALKLQAMISEHFTVRPDPDNAP